MIIALDIETIPNPDAIVMMPETDVKTGNIKDPAKIAEKKAEAKAAQVEKAALEPLTARVACVAFVMDEHDKAQIIDEATDAKEIELLQAIMAVLGKEDIRIVTYNGVGFDLPMIYKRAMILGVDPGDFGAPPLATWTKRYSTDRHYDLMQIWGGWSNEYTKLDTLARIVLGSKKTDFDVTTIAALLETEEGRKLVSDYCLQDTRLTWQLWKRFNGTMFA